MDVYSFILQRGSTLLALSVQSLSFDDNGITGLFSISHSEVVFISFPVKPLAAQSLCFGGSLCHIFTDYSSLQRVFFLFTPCIVDSFFLSVKCFLQIIKKLKSQAINAKLYLRNIISSFCTTMFAFCWQICTDCPSFRFALCLFYSIYASLASSSWNNSPEVFHPNISLG